MPRPASLLLPALIALLPVASTIHAAPPAKPLLATPDQVEAEKTLLDLLPDPELRALQATIKADLAKSTIGQTPDGAARIDYAIDEWTNSLIFKEIIAARGTPALIWSTDDTPRTWLGYTLGGAGTSGDNPDFIYRSAEIAGEGRYEITGRFAAKDKAQQLILSVYGAQSPQAPLAKNKADMGNLLALLTDRDLKVAPDGSFRVTFGAPSAGDRPNHVATGPGPISVGFRDVLADWKQRPTQLSIRRLDATGTVPLDKADVRKRVLAKLVRRPATQQHHQGAAARRRLGLFRRVALPVEAGRGDSGDDQQRRRGLCGHSGGRSVDDRVERQGVSDQPQSLAGEAQCRRQPHLCDRAARPRRGQLAG
jgi:hypothetical protein